MEFLKKLFKRKEKVVTARHRNPNNLRSKRRKSLATEEHTSFADLKSATDKGSGFNYE